MTGKYIDILSATLCLQHMQILIATHNHLVTFKFYKYLILMFLLYVLGNYDQSLVEKQD